MELCQFKEQVRRELEEDILPFWIGRMKDPRGGFLGRMDGSGRIIEGAPKGGVLNARILWTLASAYRTSGRKEYLEEALRQKKEILEHFYDRDYSGTYWSIDADGNPLETKKQIYAIGFTIYALSELYRASSDREALDYAIKLYKDIEAHSFDAIDNGYLEAFRRDWSPTEDMRLSEKDRNDAKTMNTHLHILEGYTALYRVWKDEGLHRRLKNIIELFLDKFILSDGHLALFFDMQWQSTTDIISYGHDIECSWLLEEAAQVLGEEALLPKVREKCSLMAVSAIKGWTADGGMVYEFDPSSGKRDGDRHWWVQAETVVGCLWQYRRSGDEIWYSRACAEWEFIRKHIIAPDGEWYWSLRADESPNTDDDRAGLWKCPYHNGRMCMEVIEKG